jgi:hypothetical protein
MAKDTIPTIVPQPESQIDVTISPTDALLADQGYTYNQAGVTYNQAGVMYGGLYQQNQDIIPVFFNDVASFVTPSISGIIDLGTHPAIPPGPNNQKIVGPGWFMYVSQ